MKLMYVVHNHVHVHVVYVYVHVMFHVYVSVDADEHVQCIRVQSGQGVGSYDQNTKYLQFSYFQPLPC
jgi:hypothetical protein